MKKIFKNKIVITVIVTVVVISVLGKLRRRDRANPKDAPLVRIEQPQRGVLTEFVSAPGEIEPKTKVDISAKVSARIERLPFDEGDRVTCGKDDQTGKSPASLLVQLDSKDLQSQLRSAKANRMARAAQIEVEKARIAAQKATLRATEASLARAEKDFTRQKQLFDSADISSAAFEQTKCTFDELKSQYESAQNSLRAAELNIIVMNHNLEAADAGIEQAQEMLGYTTIHSPIDGVITRINAEVGELVMTGTMNNPGTVIIQVADLSQMLLMAQVDEADIGKLKLGQKANIRIQAYPDKKFTGVVDAIALTYRRSMNNSKYFETEILIDLDDQQLYSGLTADVDIETNSHPDVLKLPSQAVLGREVDQLPLDIRENCPEVDLNKAYAAVVYRYVDGKAVVTPVKVGPSDMTHIIIESGITEDDRIVVGPYKVLESVKHDQHLRDEKEEEKKKKEKEKNKDKDKDKDKDETKAKARSAKT